MVTFLHNHRNDTGTYHTCAHASLYPHHKMFFRHSYGYKLQLTRDRSNSLINLTKICDSAKGPEVMEVEMPRHYTNILDFWSDKVKYPMFLNLKVSRLWRVSELCINCRTYLFMNKQISLIMQSFSGNDYCICVYKVQSSLIAAYYYSRMGPNGQLKKTLYYCLDRFVFLCAYSCFILSLIRFINGQFDYEKNVYA